MWGGNFEYYEGVQNCGDVFEFCGVSLSSVGGYHDSCGEATLSTVGVFSTVGMSLSSVGYL